MSGLESYSHPCYCMSSEPPLRLPSCVVWVAARSEVPGFYTHTPSRNHSQIVLWTVWVPRDKSRAIAVELSRRSRVCSSKGKGGCSGRGGGERDRKVAVAMAKFILILEGLCGLLDPSPVPVVPA